MSSNLFWLSEEQWQRIEPHLPRKVRGIVGQSFPAGLNGRTSIEGPCRPSASTASALASHPAAFG
jgi:hypothetical protein